MGKANFVDRRSKEESSEPGEIDSSQGGSVEIFDSEEDAQKRAEYVRGITEGSGLFAEYSYVRGRVFLRVSGKLTPTQAEEYEAALQRLQ